MAGAVLARADQALKAVRAFARGETGELRVGYAPSPTTEILPRALAAFQKAPAIALAEPQIAPPSTIAPCELTITAAFKRPRAQSGIMRCAAIQSSEADIVHPAPPSAATTKNASVWRTSAIKA